MNIKKTLALTLTLALAVGTASACNTTPEETSASGSDDTQPTQVTNATEQTTATTEATENTKEVPKVFEYVEFATKEVADEGNEGSLMVWGWNKEGVDLISKYSDVKFKKNVSSGPAAYPGLRDSALASGENAPDLFFFGPEYAKKYLNTDSVIPLNDIGISYDEFMDDSYDYVVRTGTDRDGVVKGLSWQGCPCGVFYNKQVAQEVLGVSEPEDVAPYFKDWDAFTETARKVKEASGGQVRIVSGTDDVWRFFLNNRSQGWIVDGQLNIDPVMEDYINFAKILTGENLTFNTTQWSGDWADNMSNHKVLAYFGSMQMLNYSMGFNDGKNKTSGEWAIVDAPSPSYLGGTWIAATKYCDMKASSAQIIRDLCINKTNLADMADGGEFVNSKSVMQTKASDDSFGSDILGGQNPLPVLIRAAESLNLASVQEEDETVNAAWIAAVSSYCAGDVDSIAEAERQFKATVEDLGIITPAE